MDRSKTYKYDLVRITFVWQLIDLVQGIPPTVRSFGAHSDQPCLVFSIPTMVCGSFDDSKVNNVTTRLKEVILWATCAEPGVDKTVVNDDALVTVVVDR